MNSSSQVQKWLPVLAVLLLGLGVRLALLDVFPDISVGYDQSGYQKQALRLLNQGILEWKYQLRAPGYIFFLAASFLPSGGADKIFVRLVQSVLGTATIACVYGIARLTFRALPRARSQLVALLAAGLFAFYPDVVFFSQTLWSETFFIFVAALAIFFVLWAVRSSRFPIAFILGGLTMGLAILSREALLLFGAGFVPLWLWLVAATRRSVGLKHALVFLAALLLVLLPWGARNYIQGRGLQLVSSQGGRDLLIYNLVVLEPRRTDRAIRVLRRENERSSNFDAELRGRIFEWIMANPAGWMLAKSAEVREVWENPQSNFSQFAQQLELVSSTQAAQLEPFLQALWWFVLGFALLGLVLPQEHKTRLLFLGYFLSWLLIFFIVHYIPRFRLGLIPFLLPYTAFGAVQLGALTHNLINRQKAGALTGDA